MFTKFYINLKLFNILFIYIKINMIYFYKIQKHEYICDVFIIFHFSQVHYWKVLTH